MGEVYLMMAARVEFTPTVRVSQPRKLFSGSFIWGDVPSR
jgi:hypothetical protein